jgi:hypothetical protein
MFVRDRSTWDEDQAPSANAKRGSAFSPMIHQFRKSLGIRGKPRRAAGVSAGRARDFHPTAPKPRGGGPGSARKKRASALLTRGPRLPSLPGREAVAGREASGTFLVLTPIAPPRGLAAAHTHLPPGRDLIRGKRRLGASAPGWLRSGGAVRAGEGPCARPTSLRSGPSLRQGYGEASRGFMRSWNAGGAIHRGDFRPCAPGRADHHWRSDCA